VGPFEIWLHSVGGDSVADAVIWRKWAHRRRRRLPQFKLTQY